MIYFLLFSSQKLHQFLTLIFLKFINIFNTKFIYIQSTTLIFFASAGIGKESK